MVVAEGLSVGMLRTGFTEMIPVLVTVASATALTVKVKLPVGVDPVVAMVSVEVPVTLTGFGEKLAVAPLGSPFVTERITESGPLPLCVNEIGNVAEPPGTTADGD